MTEQPSDLDAYVADQMRDPEFADALATAEAREWGRWQRIAAARTRDFCPVNLRGRHGPILNTQENALISISCCYRCGWIDFDDLREQGLALIADGWRDGVRWAAAEADAQASWREPIYILDLTDHLRLCATNPDRKAATPRDAAPDGYVFDADVPEPEWMGLLNSAVEDMVRQAEERGRAEGRRLEREAMGHD